MEVLDIDGFSALFVRLKELGYRTIGPTVREGTVVIDELDGPHELPVGWRDTQENARQELVHENGGRFFGIVHGQHSWKKFLYPPRTCLFTATKSGKGFSVNAGDGKDIRYACIGVRPCEAEALTILDGVLANGPYSDPGYTARRSNAFIVAVNCLDPGGTCFCASMDTGPAAKGGYDLVLTELDGEGPHRFVVDAGTGRGKEVLESLPQCPATEADVSEVDRRLADAARRMGRVMPLDGIAAIAEERFEHSRWDDVGKRCLSCANCTMVCPTCFCSSVEDTTDLTGSKAERWRRWDSCFTTDYTKIAGGNIRMSTRTRYRQWLTHKMVHWVEQFGRPGCVGCGRCITWCPASIDITEEVTALLAGTQPAEKS